MTDSISRGVRLQPDNNTVPALECRSCRAGAPVQGAGDITGHLAPTIEVVPDALHLLFPPAAHAAPPVHGPVSVRPPKPHH